MTRPFVSFIYTKYEMVQMTARSWQIAPSFVRFCLRKHVQHFMR